MKSIGIKSLITILIITLTLCSKLRRTETDTEVEATFKSFVTATVTETGGNWDKGFNCPSIFVSQGEGKEVDQGPAHIQGVKLIEDKVLNRNGLILNFVKPIAPNSLMAQISQKISGNMIYIPWRFLEPNFVFEDPLFDNKNISGNLKTDSDVNYHLKINFPYAYLTTYLEADKGNKIRGHINYIAQNNRATIRSAREAIKRSYPEYRNAKSDAENLTKGQALIDGKLVSNMAEIEVIKKNNGLFTREIAEIDIQHSKEYAALQAANAQVVKINHLIRETNANVKAMSDSIITLNKSKSDPKVQMSKAKNEEKENARKVEIEYTKLLQNTPEKAAEINGSKAAWMGIRTSEYKLKLDSFVPK